MEQEKKNQKIGVKEHWFLQGRSSFLSTETNVPFAITELASVSSANGLVPGILKDLLLLKTAILNGERKSDG